MDSRDDPLTPKPSCEELEPPANPARFNYDTFVSSQWPEQRAAMPTQAEFYESMAEYRTVFGPFGGYDIPASNS